MDVNALSDEQRLVTDGEVVWSWRPKALASSLVQDEREATVANERVHRGERL